MAYKLDIMTHISEMSISDKCISMYYTTDKQTFCGHTYLSNIDR